MNKSLSFNNICPYVRYAQFLRINSSNEFRNLKAYDCRFFYCLEGEGIICIEDADYAMTKGAMLLWQSNLKYCLISQEINSIKLLGINFDFTQNHTEKNTPIPPDKWDDFVEEKIVEHIDFTDADIFNKPIYLKNMQAIENALLEIRKEYMSKKRFYVQKSAGIFLTVLGDIARIATATTENENYNNKIDIIIEYIHNNYKNELTNIALGEIFNYHPNYINRLMLLYTGVSLHQYVLNYRITKALDLIQTTKLSISEIGNKVGFNDFTHFSKYFKKKIGRSPTDFRHIQGQKLV